MTPKQQLIYALRSGRYRKGDYYLNQSGTHSILGVVCEIYGEQFDLRCRPFQKLKWDGVFEYGLGDEWSHTNLVPPVRQWLGCDRIGSLVMPTWFEGEPTLAEIDVIDPQNGDSPLRTFLEVADLLEDAEFLKT